MGSFDNFECAKTLNVHLFTALESLLDDTENGLEDSCGLDVGRLQEFRYQEGELLIWLGQVSSWHW